MANDENLKPVRSKSEARERGKIGGIKSGEARRRKRSLKATVEGLLNNKIVLSQEERAAYDKFNIEITDDNSVMERLVAVLLVKALKGDQQSIEYIFEITGEDPQLRLKREDMRMRKALKLRELALKEDALKSAQPDTPIRVEIVSKDEESDG